jgi:hypothetical protein
MKVCLKLYLTLLQFENVDVCSYISYLLFGKGIKCAKIVFKFSAIGQQDYFPPPIIADENWCHENHSLRLQITVFTIL